MRYGSITGTEQPFIDPQNGIYTLPNLEIPGQFNNQLLGEGPEQPSRPGLRNSSKHIFTSVSHPHPRSELY